MYYYFNMQIISKLILLLMLVFTPCSHFSPITSIFRSSEVLTGDNSVEDDAQAKETFSQLVASVFEPMVKKLLHLFIRNVIALTIGVELLSMSNGDHFGIMIPQVDPQMDIEMHKTATVIVDLWMELPSMQQVELATQKSIAEVGDIVSHVLMQDDESIVDVNVTKKILQLVLQKIDLNLKNGDDAQLYETFLAAKKDLENTTALSSIHRTFFSKERMTLKSERDIYRQWFALPRVRKSMVNKLFVENSVKQMPKSMNEEYDRILLAKGIIGLSKIKDKTQQVGKLYKEVVAEMAEQFDFKAYRYLTHSSVLGGFNPEMYANKTTPILFKKLQSKFDEDADLATPLLNMKRNVIADALLEDWKPLGNGVF